jgi:predicted dehydrogenase
MIGVALLGAGFMGGSHARGYAALGERAVVRSVYSRNQERACDLAATLGATATSDLERAIADPAVDAVDVCLPTPLHREIAERALAAGKHVLLEKPIALSLEDADAIIAAAERSGRILMVGHVLRFWPEYAELGTRLERGALGRPLALTLSRLAPRVDWNDWMQDAALSGGVPVDLMVHDFDQANRLLGEPRRVFARAIGDGRHVFAEVEYDGGVAIVEGSMAMPDSYPFSAGIRAVCERGTAEYRFTAPPAPGVANIGSLDGGLGLRLHPVDGEPELVTLPERDPWEAQLAAFLDSVETARQPLHGTAEQARDALRVALAVNRSIDTGRAQAL